MLRIIFVLVFVYELSFAFFTTEGNDFSKYKEEVKILNSLDIDTTFIKDYHYNVMKSELNSYKTKYFLKVLEKGYAYIPILRKMIHDAEIPEAFLYMAMVESRFKTKARSRSGAVGLWQFMPSTARKFGLKVSRSIDERLDVIKSTEAAIKYLKYLHERFDKWYLVAIAYNCGEGKLYNALKRANTDDLSTLLDKRKKYIPRESRIYIRKIILMAHLSNNSEAIFKDSSDYLLNRSYRSTITKVKIKGGVPLSYLAKCADLSLEKFKKFNRHIKYSYTPYLKEKVNIYIPKEQYLFFLSEYDPDKKFKKYKAVKKRFFYRVKKGDSLYRISKKFKISVKMLKRFNNLKSNFLKVGKKLLIPVSKS